MARFKRAYPRNIYIHQGPPPVVAPAAITIQPAAPHFSVRHRFTRAWVGGSSGPYGGVAAPFPQVAAAQVPFQPRPFVARSASPARARVGNAASSGDGIASPVTTPQGSLSQPPPRPVIQHLPPHRAKVGPGTYLAVGRAGVQTPLGFKSQPPPRPVIAHIPIPSSRARLGLHGQAAGGVASAVSTPLGSPSQPAPRPVIQHLPRRRAVIGNNGLPGDGIAVTIPAAPQAYRRPSPQVRRPVPQQAQAGPLARASGAGIASTNVTPSGYPQFSTPPTVYLKRPIPARARLGQRSTVASGIAAARITAAAPQAYQRPPVQVRRFIPHRAITGNNGQPGDGVASTNITPQGALGPPRPFVFRSPTRARARLGNNFQPGDGVASQISTPLGSPSQPAPRPVIQHLPPHRAVWRSGASRIITPQGTVGPPRPFVFRSPLPARGRLGNNLQAADGIASQNVTPLGAPSSPAPRPVIQHLPAHRAVWRGNDSRNITLQGIAGPPRPFVWRSPLPARARLGNNLACGDGYLSSISTPQGSPSSPAPRPVIQHLPPHRAVWRGLASTIVTPSGIVAPPRKTQIFPPKVTRARIGAGSVAGGIASTVLTPPFVTFVTTYQRTAPQIKRPAPARALTGRGGCGSGIASRVVTPPLGSPSNPAARPVIQHLPPHRAVWRGNAAPPVLITVYQRKPFVFRSPLPARARLGNNLQPGDGIAGRVSTLQGITGLPRPFVWRSPAPSRGKTGPRGAASGGYASQAVTPQGSPQQTVPVVEFRPPPPARVLWHGGAGRIALATQRGVRPFVFRSPLPTRARLGSNLQPAAGIASHVVTPLGSPQQTVPVLEFRPRPQRALWRGIAARVPVAAPLTAYQRPPPPPRSPAPHRALWHGHTAPPTPLGAPQVTVPVVEFRPPPPQRVLWRGLANLTSRTPPVTPVGFIQPALPFIDFRPPPPPRGYFGPHRIIGPEPVPAGPGTPGAYQRTAPQVKRPAPARAWIGHGGTAGGIASRIVTPLGKLGPPRPFVARSPLPPRPRGLWRGLASHVITPRGTLPPPRKVPQFPPKITRARIGPLSAIAGGIASPIVTPPPPAPGILPQPTWTVAATVPLTVDAAPTVPMTIVVNPTAPMTIDITPGATHLPPPGQQVIPAQPQVRLNPELPPPIGQPS